MYCTEELQSMFDRGEITSANKFTSIEDVKFLYGLGVPVHENNYIRALYMGDLDSVKWYREIGMKWEPYMFHIAIQSKNRELVDYLREMNCSCVGDAIYWCLLYMPDMELLRYIFVRVDSKHISERLLIEPLMKCGDVEILKYMNEQGLALSSEAWKYATNIEILEYLCEYLGRETWCDEYYLRSIFVDNIEVFEYLYGVFGTEDIDKLLEIAKKNNAKRIVEYLQFAILDRDILK